MSDNLSLIPSYSLREQLVFCIPVKSDTSDDIYQVQLVYVSSLNKFELDCSCRMKFGLTTKRKCKHIARCVHSMLTEYAQLNNNKKEHNLELSSMLSNMSL